MNKKALAEKRMVLLIIAGFVLLIVLLFVGQTGIFIMKQTGELGCELSVIQHSIGKEKMSLPDTDINCPRNYIVFYDSEETATGDEKGKVEMNGNKYWIKGEYAEKTKQYDEEDLLGLAPITTFDELTEDIVNFVLAEEMSSCWETMGEGGLDIFAESLVRLFVGTDFGEDTQVTINNPCLIWSIITFDDSVSEDFEAKGLLDYMKENVPIELEKGDTTYYDHIFLPQTKKFLAVPYGVFESLQIDENLVIEPGKTYFIYYRAAKKAKTHVFSENWYGVYLSEFDKLKESCDYIYN